MSLAAVISVAGSGSRLNGDHPELSPDAKHLELLLRGQTHPSWALAAGFDVFAAVGGTADLRTVAPEAVTLLPKDTRAKGLATSLRAIALKTRARSGLRGPSSYIDTLEDLQRWSGHHGTNQRV